MIDVIITKGLFQRQAVLKVVDFGKDYSCSVSYSNVVETLKNTKIDFIVPQAAIKTSTVLTEIGDHLTILSSDSTFHCLFTNSNSLDGGNVVIKASTLLELLATELGVTITGTLLSDSDFLELYLLMPEYSHEIILSGSDYILNQLKIGDSVINCSEIFKSISHIFMCNIEYGNNEISFNLVNATSNGVNLEGFDSVIKKFSSGYLNQNYIKYTNEGDNEYFASDVFTAEGNGTSEVIKISAVIPKTDTQGYITTITGDLVGKTILFIPDTYETKTMTLSSYSIVVDIASAAILTMSGFYSSILNPIFANPVILEASRYIDPLTADTIMTNRVINSVQLGGRYWVDTMAYNLTTGQSKLTLIKLS